MPPLTIPPARMSRWTSVPFQRTTGKPHLNYDKDLNLDRPVYRYMQAEHLLDYLRTGQFYFSDVRSWPDPFEQWWHRILFEGDTPLLGAQAFASCWTWHCRDEPFWRLYEERCGHRDSSGEPLPKGTPPVRIKSTLRRVVDGLSDALRQANMKVFVAPVSYTTTAELLRYKSSLKDDPAEIAREAAHALTYKRLGFRYEKEVRIIVVDSSGLEGGRRIALVPSALIEQIMIGPVPESEVKRASDLRERLKASFSGSIKRSLIYRPPLEMHRGSAA